MQTALRAEEEGWNPKYKTKAAELQRACAQHSKTHSRHLFEIVFYVRRFLIGGKTLIIGSKACKIASGTLPGTCGTSPRDNFTCAGNTAFAIPHFSQACVCTLCNAACQEFPLFGPNEQEQLLFESGSIQKGHSISDRHMAVTRRPLKFKRVEHAGYGLRGSSRWSGLLCTCFLPVGIYFCLVEAVADISAGNDACPAFAGSLTLAGPVVALDISCSGCCISCSVTSA